MLGTSSVERLRQMPDGLGVKCARRHTYACVGTLNRSVTGRSGPDEDHSSLAAGLAILRHQRHLARPLSPLCGFANICFSRSHLRDVRISRVRQQCYASNFRAGPVADRC